jgi:hypothetical protein
MDTSNRLRLSGKHSHAFSFERTVFLKNNFFDSHCIQPLVGILSPIFLSREQPMNTLTKRIVLLALVMSLSACANYPNSYNSYPDNDSFSSGANYPGSYSTGYGNYQNNNYPQYPAQSGYGGYGRPYNRHPGNNNYYQNNNYYNRPQPQNYPQPYRQHGGGSFDHHRDHDDHHQNGGGWQNGNNQPQPMNGRHQAWQNPQPRREEHPNGGGWQGHNNQQPMPNHHGNGVNQHPNGGGWQGQHNQPQQHVQVPHNDGGNSNFGVINERMGQQPVQPQHNGHGNNHRRHEQP